MLEFFRTEQPCTSDALLFADPTGDVLVTNPAFHDGFGQPDIKAIEHVLRCLADEQQMELVSTAVMDVIQKGERQRITVQVADTDNGIKDIDLALIPVRSSEEDPLNGILLSGRDITQQKEIERFKARFVADALHDLATPISGISTRVYLLQRNPENLTAHVDALQNQVQHLKNLLEDLRTLSKLDRSQVELNLEPCHINDLVKLVFDTYEPVALDKQQTLSFNLAQELPQVMLDKRQIERVLVNLVANAINYTPESKTITIETSLNNEVVLVSVTDEGMGIGADDLPHVFERFYRTDEARQAQTGGTGLGLAISKNIVELHGGTVSVASDLGQGSTFSLRLPLVNKG